MLDPITPERAQQLHALRREHATVGQRCVRCASWDCRIRADAGGELIAAGIPVSEVSDTLSGPGVRVSG